MDFSILPLLWYYSSYTTSWVGGVVVVAGDEVDVDVEDGLAGGWVDVDSNIVTVWVVLVVEFLLGLVYYCPEFRLFLRGEIKIVGDVSLGND